MLPLSVRHVWKSAVRVGIVAAAVAGTASIAHATTLGGTFNISVYNGYGGGNINSPGVQADKSNPLLLTTPIGTGTYTGDLSFSQGSNGTDTIGAFLASGGGTLSSGLNNPTFNNTTLSTGNFATTSVFVITGSTASILAGYIDHDDGISLYDGAGYSTTVADSHSPTVDIPTSYSGLFGPWELIYVEANGLPAVLNFVETRSEAPPSTTPIPAALPLFASGLGGIGLFGWAKKKKKHKARA